MKFLDRFSIAATGMALLFATISCKQEQTCKEYTQRQIKCATKIKKKDREGLRLILWNFCNTRRNKQKTRALMKESLLCLKEKTCKNFLLCQQKAVQSSRTKAVEARLAARLLKIKKWASKGNFYKAQHACSERNLKRKTLEESGISKRALQTFHQYCLQKMPGWLKTLSQTAQKNPEFQTCYDTTYLTRARGTPAQTRKIQERCTVLRFAQKLYTVRSKRSLFLKMGQFPWQCHAKEAAPIKRLKRKVLQQSWLHSFHQLCYFDIGIKLLRLWYPTMLSKKEKFCGYYPRKIIRGFVHWKLRSPKDQKVLNFFQKLCRKETQ